MSQSLADQYEVLELIGRGSFGQIRKVRRKTDGHILVRKEISYHRMSDKERQQLTAECGILSQVKHPNIVEYYARDHVKADQTLHLYMEFCGNGDLSKTIRDCRSNGSLLPEATVWSYFTQILLALYRCHNGVNPPSVATAWASTATNQRIPGDGKPLVKILHRDLKPENIFLGEGNNVKLGDFGLSKQLAPEQHLANTYVGTPYYMSPEIVSDLSYTHKSDIWSLGCIIYELCNLSPPFNAKTQWSLIDKIKSGKYPPIPNLFSPELRRVIDMCLRTDSRQRPDTGELLEMDIFKTLRKERELILYDRELQSKETRLRLEEQQLRGRLVELQHEERQLHGKALEMQRAFDTKTSQLQSQIDAQLRREWEIRAQQEIDRQVDLRVEERVERELERRIQEQVDVRVHTELMRKLKEYDLANRHSQDQLHTPPPTLTGSLGSSGASSGFSVSESSPPHGHYSRLIPDSPCDITMASPTAATPYRHNNHYHYNPHPHLEDAPKFTQMLQENSQQQQHASSLMPPPPITPIRSHAFSAPMLQDISNEPNTVVQAESSKATIKRATSAYPSSPTRVRRQGLQRAGTTGLLFGQPDKAFAIGGRSNSFDEAAAREADGGGSMARARSIVEITRMKRITKPAPKWDQESDDAPSPYLKRNTRRPRY